MQSNLLSKCVKGTPNINFLLDLVDTRNSLYSVHELGTELGVLTNQECVLAQVPTLHFCLKVEVRG